MAAPENCFTTFDLRRQPPDQSGLVEVLQAELRKVRDELARVQEQLRAATGQTKNGEVFKENC